MYKFQNPFYYVERLKTLKEEFPTMTVKTVTKSDYRKAQNAILQLVNNGGAVSSKDRRYYAKMFGDKVIRNLKWENIV